MVNVKLAQRFVRSLARKAGEGWGEGNGHGEFHYRGWQLAMPVNVKMSIGFIRLLSALLLVLVLPVLVFPAHASEPANKPPIRIGLSPVFLDDQAKLVNAWRSYLERNLGQPVIFVHRGSYREIINLLRDKKLDFAWVCSYPYVSNKKFLRLVAVPLYEGEPLYQSYLIVPSSDKQTQSLEDLRSKNFAFSDPDSNSGHLYTQYLLAKQHEKPSSFFTKTFFTWSHRKVIEAVAAGLTQGGAVDGYVWETLALSDPELTSKTRIVEKSRKFGHPPFVASQAASKQQIGAMQQALFNMTHDVDGEQILRALNLDGFVYGTPALFDDIEEMARLVRKNNATR